MMLRSTTVGGDASCDQFDSILFGRRTYRDKSNGLPITSTSDHVVITVIKGKANHRLSIKGVTGAFYVVKKILQCLLV
jgi:hypothetical protein